MTGLSLAQKLTADPLGLHVDHDPLVLLSNKTKQTLSLIQTQTALLNLCLWAWKNKNCCANYFCSLISSEIEREEVF